jgi:hypothetical protein
LSILFLDFLSTLARTSQHEYAWYTWHTNKFCNLLGFVKNFIYYFTEQDEKLQAGITNASSI